MTPAIPLVSNPQTHKNPGSGEKAKPKSVSVSPKKCPHDHTPVATIGPQPRTPERPDEDHDLKPEERETPRMVLAQSSAGSSPAGSTMTGVKIIASSSAPTSPVAADPPLLYRQQTSGVVDEEDEEEDIYSPSLPPAQAAAKTDLTAAGPPHLATPNLVEHRRSDTDLLNTQGVNETTNEHLTQRRSDEAVTSRFIQEQQPVNPLTHSTDQYSEYTLSESRLQAPGPSCVIQPESAVKGIQDEHSSVSPLSSSEMSSEALRRNPVVVHANPAAVQSNPPFTIATTILPAVAIDTAAVGSDLPDMASLSGSWVGVERDGAMEQGQGDASGPSAPMEDSDDDIDIIDEEEENGGRM